jgi:microsomal dipeptidase-like Zn-dependent dipeptidase
MGVEHVGFALDQIQGPTPDEFFTSPDWPPEAAASVSVTDWPWSDTFHGMENQSGYMNLTRGLVAKGYSDEDIRKVMGQNHLRLIGEVVG